MKKKQDREKLLSLIFSKEGLLGKSLEYFEERKGQQEMAGHILAAYEEKGIALIEAGTGTGKSLAYLFPAVYWALKNQEKTIIATHTIALQEQLLLKDIPFLLSVMDADLKACLVKGMGNYVCLRRLNEHLAQLLLIETEELKQMEAISSFVHRKQEGSFSAFPFPVSPSVKAAVCAESDTCNHVQCPYYKECFFFKERKQALDSQILVVNQHLLLADMQRRLRNPGQESILPEFQRVIIDEVHHFEQIALESFAQKWDRIDCLRYLARMYSEAHPEKSRLTLLRHSLSTLPQIPPSLLQKLEIDLPAQKRTCQGCLEEASLKLSDFFSLLTQEKKVRITGSTCENPAWKTEVIPSLIRLSDELQKMALMLQSVLKDLEAFKETPIYASLSVHSVEIGAASQKLESMGIFLVDFTKQEPDQKRVRWFESTISNTILVDAALDISLLLHEHLFAKLHTSILCSATMATAQSFEFVKKRLGLTKEQKRIREEIFESSFDYEKRVLFTVPVDFPMPSSADFLPDCIDAMGRIIEISRGSVFLLFTSYEMLQQCYQALSLTPLKDQYPFLKQGQLPRHLLLETFKNTEGSVLFATDSFWEGVDVPGEALRCVVIAKLPFSVPRDPLYEAYAEELEKEGLDPFLDYAVPQAVIKFKQGFGRLMRNKEDRGCVVCLDHRMVKKGYGKQFLKSLPACKTFFGNKKEMFAQMQIFYDTVKAGA